VNGTLETHFYGNLQELRMRIAARCREKLNIRVTYSWCFSCHRLSRHCSSKRKFHVLITTVATVWRHALYVWNGKTMANRYVTTRYWTLNIYCCLDHKVYWPTDWAT